MRAGAAFRYHRRAMATVAIVVMYAAFLLVGWLAARKVKHGHARPT